MTQGGKQASKRSERWISSISHACSHVAFGRVLPGIRVNNCKSERSACERSIASGQFAIISARHAQHVLKLTVPRRDDASNGFHLLAPLLAPLRSSLVHFARWGKKVAEFRATVNSISPICRPEDKEQAKRKREKSRHDGENCAKVSLNSGCWKKVEQAKETRRLPIGLHWLSIDPSM